MKPTVKFVLRLPGELHAEIKAEAVRDDRSLHNLILRVLSQRFLSRTDRNTSPEKEGLENG